MTETYSILIADDNDDDVSLLEQGFADIQVRVSLARAHDGAEALEMLREGHSFRLVVIDFYLPKKTGAEVVETLRARGVDTSKIAILTSHLSGEQRQRLVKAGVGSILQKPNDLDGFAQLATQLVNLIVGT